MSEKRPDFGLEEELKRRLKLDGSATTSAANRETLKLQWEKEIKVINFGICKNPSKEMKRKVKFDVPASGSAANQEILKPPTQKRNQDMQSIIHFIHIYFKVDISLLQIKKTVSEIPTLVLDKEMKRKVKLDAPASTGSVANRETLEPPMEKETKRKVKFDVPASTGSVANQKNLKPPTEKRNQGEEMKRNVTFDLPASGSVANQETLKPPREKEIKVTLIFTSTPSLGFFLFQDVICTSLSLPRSTSKDQTPTLLWKKKLTCDDLHAGNLKASYHGLSLNWNKFAKEHGLQPNDVIFFYDDDSISEYYIIHYEKSGEGHSESREGTYLGPWLAPP
ncbi:hypothetical protein CK203_091037 [Vitis vinifera]|uniref:TF-B3 domain-containing protein n=1 Tax=Vitis vinifera TaxID=29760 RepID=A0A438BVA9_VITVI|nr:hypothetical protein CK203_091037 [Vitis vinifera]